MPDKNILDPGHEGKRRLLLALGVILLAVGALLMIVGLWSLFSGFGHSRTLFLCCFAAMPLLFVGTTMLMFASLGKVIRYQAGEVAPVAKDTFNYLARNSTDGIKDIAGAVREGISGQTTIADKKCAGCGTSNDAGARFCDNCGTVLPGP